MNPSKTVINAMTAASRDLIRNISNRAGAV